MRHLSLAEGAAPTRALLAQAGGLQGIQDAGALQSAPAQPRATCDGTELYPGACANASALAYGLISNHPFVDGNKRTGHAAMIAFLALNGLRIGGRVDEHAAVVLQVASGVLGRHECAAWLRRHAVPG